MRNMLKVYLVGDGKFLNVSGTPLAGAMSNVVNDNTNELTLSRETAQMDSETVKVAKKRRVKEASDKSDEQTSASGKVIAASVEKGMDYEVDGSEEDGEGERKCNQETRRGN